MRFLGIGDSCDLGELYLRLLKEDHEVKVFIADEMAAGTLAGLVPRSPDWKDDLPWIREVGSSGIILFENVSGNRGVIQDNLRRDGFNVIGGSAFGDRIENDRAYGQSLLRSLGLQTAGIFEFNSVSKGLAFIKRNPARYVLKFNGSELSSSDNYVGKNPGGHDVAAVLHSKKHLLEGRENGFVLMQHVDGIEMGVGAYFDGNSFVEPACLDWEHKRFFPGDLGELTGEMGTVATFDRSKKFFSRTLCLLTSVLRREGYCGYINLNTIVNDNGIWPLEFTCRFGYPGYAVLTPLQKTQWSDLFASLIAGQGVLETRHGFSVGVVLTTPPFPYDRKVVKEAIGLPIFIDGGLTTREREQLHFGEVALENEMLVTAGYSGWTMVVTGTGDTIQQARSSALKLADRIHTPNVRYRRDIGEKLICGDWARLEELQYLD